ncbi:MAG TPA: DUF2167 domain-containing protein [Thermoanaerobaculia bacterium]|nr:DUF2167 domain-containing protein [Thermoanaerobaculia bacterium]
MHCRAIRVALFAALPAIGALSAIGAAAQPAQPSAQPPRIDWVRGPSEVTLGTDVAAIKLPEGYRFAGADDTRRLMERMGNPPAPGEVGLITPSVNAKNWFLLFTFHDVGFVKDDDKDKIDSKELLESIRNGTEEANKERARMGTPAIHVVGWYEEPHYDARTHNLVWAIKGRDDREHSVINYDVRLLGRRGYMSGTLVADPDGLAAARQEVEALLQGFSYKQGHRYAEWMKGDKVAEYGLAALVAGGAGAAAAKLGLFAKLGKFLAKGYKLIVAAFAALIAALRKLFGFGDKRTKKEEDATPAPPAG